MASPLSELNTLMNMAQEADPYKKISGNPDAREAIKQLGAIKLLNARLKEIEDLKSQGGIGVTTGPFVGRWKATGDPNAQAQEQPPGILSSIIGKLVPKKELQKRTELERLIRSASQYAFETGGKSLTGTEAARSDASIVPSMFTEDMLGTVKNIKEKEVPRMMDQRIFTLRNMGISDDVIKKAIEDIQGGAQ